MAGQADVDHAVGRRVSAQARWARLAPGGALEVPVPHRRLIQERSRELAIVETMDGGKPIKESRDIDVPLAAAHFFTTPAGPTSCPTRFRPRRHVLSGWPRRSCRGTSRC